MVLKLKFENTQKTQNVKKKKKKKKKDPKRKMNTELCALSPSLSPASASAWSYPSS